MPSPLFCMWPFLILSFNSLHVNKDMFVFWCQQLYIGCSTQSFSLALLYFRGELPDLSISHSHWPKSLLLPPSMSKWCHGWQMAWPLVEPSTIPSSAVCWMTTCNSLKRFCVSLSPTVQMRVVGQHFSLKSLIDSYWVQWHFSALRSVGKEKLIVAFHTFSLLVIHQFYLTWAWLRFILSLLLYQYETQPLI